MAVAWDATMLSLLLHQTARIPAAPGSKTPITQPRERIEKLLADLTKQKETILIPAPALTEFLYLVEEAGPGYIQTIDKKASFEVAPFDEKAAIEAAEMMKKFKKEDGQPSGPGEGFWQKVKVDQQIVAIAKAESVDCLYTADHGMAKMAKRIGVPVVGLWDLEPPPSKTPLLDQSEQSPEEDEEPPSDPSAAASSTATEPPSSQSPVAEKPKEPSPEPPRPEAPQGAQGPQQPDSSPAPKPPPSEK